MLLRYLEVDVLSVRIKNENKYLMEKIIGCIID